MESIIILYILYFSKKINEYITNIIPTENHYLKILYDLSLIEEYKQEQILHGNFYLLSTILLAPICEEILFRGLFFKKMLKYGLSATKSIFISSFLFGFSHINLWQCITAVLIGSIIGMIYYKTKSLFFCILSHSLNNILTIIFSSLCKISNISSLWSSVFFTFIGLCLTLYLLVTQKQFAMQKSL